MTQDDKAQVIPDGARPAVIGSPIRITADFPCRVNQITRGQVISLSIEAMPSQMAIPRAIEVYQGSDGELTKAYYAELEKRGPVGLVSVCLFRAQKCSARAKVYRGGIRGRGSFKSMAYERKSWSMGLLCDVLAKHSEALNIRYGWKEDHSTVFGSEPSWVLYIDLPQGQCSFHSPTRGDGPEYPGDYDGYKKSAERILQFCDAVMAMEVQES